MLWRGDEAILSRMDWNDRFTELFKEAVERHQLNPRLGAERFFLPEECDFLESIGYRPEEMFGFVTDYATLGEPSPSLALLIASTRRSFFLTTQRGISGNAVPVRDADLPKEHEEFQEIPYLPRIIRKAEAKLFGTLDTGLMYPCAKDRQFLREHGNIHPDDFLHLVWHARGDRQKLVSAVLHAIQVEQEAATKAAPEPHEESTPQHFPIQSQLKLD